MDSAVKNKGTEKEQFVKDISYYDETCPETKKNQTNTTAIFYVTEEITNTDELFNRLGNAPNDITLLHPTFSYLIV